MVDYELAQLLDHTQIIFNQIERTNRSLENKKEYIENVEALDDNLVGYQDDRYKKEIKELNTWYSQAFQKLKTIYGSTTKDPKEVFNLRIERSRRQFRLLNQLISRSGFLPHKKKRTVLE